MRYMGFSQQHDIKFCRIVQSRVAQMFFGFFFFFLTRRERNVNVNSTEKTWAMLWSWVKHMLMSSVFMETLWVKIHCVWWMWSWLRAGVINQQTAVAKKQNWGLHLGCKNMHDIDFASPLQTWTQRCLSWGKSQIFSVSFNLVIIQEFGEYAAATHQVIDSLIRNVSYSSETYVRISLGGRTQQWREGWGSLNTGLKQNAHSNVKQTPH